MPIFLIHLRRQAVVEPNDLGIEFRDLHHAYLDVCKSIPDTARDLLIEGKDPMACAYLICDARGRRLMEIPFAELLSPTEWRTPRARHRPRGGVRSHAARDDLALSSFRRIFSPLNAGCVLMTPELEIREMNDFCARHSQVDAEAIRGVSILDTFVDLAGQSKVDFDRAMLLARAGAVAQIIDMPYHVLDAEGRLAEGWWNSRTWPIFDDDNRIIGLVGLAEPFTSPTAGGRTKISIAPGSTA